MPRADPFLCFSGFHPFQLMGQTLAASNASLANEAAQRYASALFELSQDKAQLETVHADLQSFAGLVRDNADLKRLIDSPAFGRDEKVKALTEIAAKSGVSELVGKFVGAMAANGRARDIPGACIAFDTLYAKQRGVKRAMARTA